MRLKVLRKGQRIDPTPFRPEVDAYVIRIESANRRATRYISHLDARFAGPDTGQHALLGTACSECIQKILREGA